MTILLKTFIHTACCAALIASGTAQAHYLWIESGDSGARLYYGEPDALLKEKSPGKLDNIKSPKAFVQDTPSGKPGAVTISRAAEYFAIANNKGTPAILAVEESLEVRDLTKHGLGFAKSNYYARYGQAATDSSASPLVLDIHGSGPNKLAVVYRGQPLKDAKLEVIAPNTWMQEHKTDAQGAVHINTPWRGQYVVHVLHIDQAPGEFSGKKYDSLRNHLTYTFTKADGSDPGPAVPPKHEMD
ncbi:DUF4198 domain-containing protein [Noviherbaspirillum saxi]|uniref:DUF4198 domain-containing protein n=1 Tax=Noviherbaspirillum saxi TaxID=2320863 RepID=A0A3A3FP84_9BURK|nr:DUF4198 domain-containing protein [Noviherbaspirillum saxi]RJF95499.1 DUF4198 domain-containing protein [Noviherbaspirillum saxi]